MFYFKKPPRVVIITIIVLLAALGVLSVLNPAVETDVNPPRIYAHAENSSQAELIQLDFSWDFGNTPSPDVRQWDTGRDAYALLSISNWDKILNSDFSDTGSAPPIITLGVRQIMKLSAQKDSIVSGYDSVLSYMIWRTDGTIYDNGHGGLVAMADIGHYDGVAFLTAPSDLGEYIYDVTLKFDRGIVRYSFKVVVD